MKKLIFLAMLPLVMASCSSDDLGDGGKMTYKAIQLNGAETQVSTTVNDFSVRYAFEAFNLNSFQYADFTIDACQRSQWKYTF